jgi:hypothetical protein
MIGVSAGGNLAAAIALELASHGERVPVMGHGASFGFCICCASFLHARRAP